MVCKIADPSILSFDNTMFAYDKIMLSVII